MESLRIEKKDIYRIEVNDNGDTIEFDLADIELPFKFQRAIDRVKQEQTKLKGTMLLIDKKKDKIGKDEFMSENEKKRLQAYKDCFAGMRAAMDEFLGEGGCQKIFGDRNYVTMFDDLFEALQAKGEDGTSHLDRMRLTSAGIMERISKKYGSKQDSDSIDIS